MKRQPTANGKRWSWHYRALLSLRDQLLEQRVQRLREASEPLERHSMDMSDSATDEFDHDLALSRLSADQDALYEVEEALKRIQNETYGVCAETGKPIPEERLKAIPWTRFTREVEERLERKGQIVAPHLGEARSVRTGQPGLPQPPESNADAEIPAASDQSLHPVVHPSGSSTGSSKRAAHGMKHK